MTIENKKTFSFDWKLEKKNSIYNKLDTYEYVDKHLLYGFINSGMGVTFRDNKKYEKRNIKYESEKIQISNYANLLKEDDYIYTSYNLPKHGWGRINPSKQASLCVFIRKTRHTLAKDNYIDIDMVNCHSNIYLAYAKYHQLPHVELSKYCKDPKVLRQTIISHHLPEMIKETNQEKLNELKDIAKNLPIRLANGGTYKQWCKDYEIKITNEHPDILAIEKELKSIMNIVFENNKHILDDVRKAKCEIEQEGKGVEKDKRTVMSLWSQTIERHLQEEAINYISDYIDLESIIPCQDGFLVPKEAIEDWEYITDDINNHVNSIYPFNIEFIIKPMDEGIPIPKHKKLNGKLELLNSDETGFFKIKYDCNKIEQSQLNLPYKEFKESDVYIIESGTGTGKSSLIAKFYAQYKQEFPESKILLLSNLTSILEQLQKTFINVGNIDISSYTNEKVDIINSDCTLCINSILKIAGCDFSNTILYIDEPTNLFFGLSDNSTMMNTKGVIAVFIQLFKQCKKIILTDAHLTTITERLIKLRQTKKNKICYYKNSYKKFQNVTATNILDENVFLDKLINNVKSGNKFIFASDSRVKTTGFYKTCLNNAREEDKNKFFLITKHTKEIDVCNIDYNNAYIFLSPRVVCGLSIITKSSLDSFIYITGQSINPIALYQQATRNRTMKELYYYVDDKSKWTREYKSYESCKSFHKLNVYNFEHLTNCCVEFDELENTKINENFYFNLHCSTEYINSLMFKNIKYYFETELINAGFTLKTNYAESNNTADIRSECLEYDNEQIDKMKEALTNESKISSTNLYEQRREYLNIKTVEDVENYRSILRDDKTYECFNKFDKLLRSRAYVEDKIKVIRQNKFSIDAMNCEYSKILLIRQYEDSTKINKLDIENPGGKCCEFSNTFVNALLSKFRWKGLENETEEDVKNTYVKMIKAVCKGLGLFKRKQKQIDGERKYIFNFDREKLQSIFNLILMKSNNDLSNYDYEIISNLEKYVDIPKNVIRKKIIGSEKTIIEYMYEDNE